MLTANLNEPVSLEYEIYNSSDTVLDTVITVDENDDFYIGGELKSTISLMPFEGYMIRYNLLPLQIGRLPFPKVNIMDKDRNVMLIKGYTRKCLIVK